MDPVSLKSLTRQGCSARGIQKTAEKSQPARRCSSRTGEACVWHLPFLGRQGWAKDDSFICIREPLDCFSCLFILIYTKEIELIARGSQMPPKDSPHMTFLLMLSTPETQPLETFQYSCWEGEWVGNEGWAPSLLCLWPLPEAIWLLLGCTFFSWSSPGTLSTALPSLVASVVRGTSALSSVAWRKACGQSCHLPGE